MGRAPCCSKVGLHRGSWTPPEDALLTTYIQAHGEGQWRSLPKRAGLLRCGKSCRLRWMNYLRPDIKRGNITSEEDDLIIRMHSLLGNRWSLIAGRIPGRTDNEIKNYWNTHLSKKLRDQGNGLAKKPEKRKKNGGEKKKKDKSKGIEVKSEKTLSSIPRTNSTITLESNLGSVSTTQEKEQSQQEAKEIWEVVGNDNKGFGIRFFAEHDDDMFNNCDVECESTDHHGTLEKLYEEYLQLLNTGENLEELDSFVDPLLP